MSHKTHDHDDDDEEEYEVRFEHHHDGPGGFLTGLLIGGVVGATAAVLMAPFSGRELRHRIKTQAEDVREQAVEVAGEARAKAAELQETGREMLDRNKQRLVNTAEAVKQSAKEAWKTNGGTHLPADTPSSNSPAM